MNELIGQDSSDYYIANDILININQYLQKNPCCLNTFPKATPTPIRGTRLPRKGCPIRRPLRDIAVCLGLLSGDLLPRTPVSDYTKTFIND